MQTAAIAALRPHLVGRNVETDPGSRRLRAQSDRRLAFRWLGPEKGVMHMAIGAVINAAWDMAARAAGKPVWRLIAEMSPQQLVDTIDFRYISDALTPEEALGICATPRRDARANAAAAVRWLSGLHHLAGVARVLG